MAKEIATYSENEARGYAADLRIKYATGNIQAEQQGERWVIAKYDGNKRFVLTKPAWRAV
jgi:hypothetical protein